MHGLPRPRPKWRRHGAWQRLVDPNWREVTGRERAHQCRFYRGNVDGMCPERPVLVKRLQFPGRHGASDRYYCAEHGLHYGHWLDEHGNVWHWVWEDIR